MHGIFQGDQLALGMTGGQCFLGGLAVQSFGDLVDGFGVSFGHRDISNPRLYNEMPFDVVFEADC